MNTSSLRRLILTVAVTPMLTTLSYGQNVAADQQSFRSTSPRYAADGQLIRPNGWRKWVYIGTPVTPHDMNDGAAAFPEFHNVYMDPDSFSTYEKTGEFPNATMIAKELVLVGSKAAVSGNGYFMGEFQGLEVTIKDTERFSKEPGGWAYFSFGHTAEYANTAKMFETSKCNSCHENSADQDFVFTQYYPVLRAADPKNRKVKKVATQMDDTARNTASDMLGGNGGAPKNDEYSKRLFKWLQAKNYKDFKAESTVHVSAAQAAHGEVRAFANDKLVDSLAAGNRSHPVGSFACKELYKDGKMIGWATSLKVKEDAGDGSGWYWYENLSTTDAKSPVAAGLGAKLCIGCHGGGQDFVMLRGIK